MRLKVVSGSSLAPTPLLSTVCKNFHYHTRSHNHDAPTKCMRPTQLSPISIASFAIFVPVTETWPALQTFCPSSAVVCPLGYMQHPLADRQRLKGVSREVLHSCWFLDSANTGETPLPNHNRDDYNEQSEKNTYWDIWDCFKTVI